MKMTRNKNTLDKNIKLKVETLTEVRVLRLQISVEDKWTDLERRVDDLGQYSRMNEVVVTGLQIKPWLYAHA